MAQIIDDFNRGVALILAYLYARFPIPAHVKVADPTVTGGAPDSDGRDSKS